jgi:hypothetical protein
MKLLLGILLLSFIGGIALRRRSANRRAAMLVALCALACFGYYFMGQI